MIVFSTSSVIFPICLPEIIKSIPATFAKSGSIETTRNFAVLIVLVISSTLTKFWSKKNFISLGQLLISMGLLLMSYSQNYLMMVISIILMGVGGGLSEAFLNPIIVDIHPNSSGKYLNLSNSFYPLGIIGSALIFGELLMVDYSWNVIFRIAAVVTFISSIVFNKLNFPHSNSKKSSIDNYLEIFTLRGFWIFAVAIFLGGGIESALTFWGRSFVKEYFSDIPRTGTFAVIIFAAAMAIGRILTAYFSKYFSIRIILMSSTILGLAASIFYPFISNLLEFYYLIAATGLATACFWPTILAEADARLNINTTILFIILAFFGVLGFGITPLIIGIIGDYSNLKISFISIPLFFVILTFVLILEKRTFVSNSNSKC